MLEEDRLYNVVSEALQQDRLTLPSLPEVALRIGKICRDENVTAARIATEVARDPGIAVRLLRVANSSALRGGKRIDSVQQAVARLGISQVRSLVAGLALQQLYYSKTTSMRDQLRRTWANAVEVAALAQVLAMHRTKLRPEMAMLAGLVHEIGRLPVLRFAESLSDPPPDTKQIDRAARALQPRIGRLILTAWDFPADLIDVPASWMNFARRHDGEPDYVDVVTVAALQSHEGRTGRYAGIARERTPAFERIGLNPEVDVFELDGVKESYEENLSALAA